MICSLVNCWYNCKTAANPYIIRILSCGYYRSIMIVIIAYDEDV